MANPFKPSNYFSSMEEVKDLLENLKIRCSPEEYQSLKILLGLGEQEGEYVEVEGIGKIDKFIALLVKRLNEKGFQTLSSCSGLASDHPTDAKPVSGYLSFTTDSERNKDIQFVCETCGLSLNEGEIYLQPALTVRFEGSTDEELKTKWRMFGEKLIGETWV